MALVSGGFALTKIIHNEARAYAAGVDVLADGAVAKRLHLLPMGTFKTRDGRGPFHLRDRAHAEAVIAATRDYAGRQDPMVDYDHQSIFGVKPGVAAQAPAAGWLKPDSLTVEPDGIWCNVEWTASGQAKLDGREYRYLSPYFGHHKSTGDVTRIFNAGLTGIPAIDELDAIAASATQDESMDLKAIAKALGLGDDATEAQVTASIVAIKAANDTAAAELKAVASALGLADGANAEALVAAATSASHVDETKYVPIALFTELRTQVATLQAGQVEDKAAAAVDAAVSAGKVTPAQREWALGYAKKDLAGFEGYVAAAAVVVQPGAKPRDPAAVDTMTLTDEEREVCAITGVDPAAFLETKKQEMR